MPKVNFYDSIDDSMLKFAVIIAKHNGKWVFCKHRERSEYYGAVTPEIRQAGNRLSGLPETNYYASLLE